MAWAWIAIIATLNIIPTMQWGSLTQILWKQKGNAWDKYSQTCLSGHLSIAANLPIVTTKLIPRHIICIRTCNSSHLWDYRQVSYKSALHGHSYMTMLQVSSVWRACGRIAQLQLPWQSGLEQFWDNTPILARIHLHSLILLKKVITNYFTPWGWLSPCPSSTSPPPPPIRF